MAREIEPSTRWVSRIGGFVVVAAAFGLWEASARFGWVQSQSWPSFSNTVVELLRSLWSGELSRVAVSSIVRMFTGYVIGGVLGITLGIVLGRVSLLGRLMLPVIESFRPLPIPALVPPMVLLLGIDDTMKIFVIALSVFFPVLVSTLGGVRGIDDTFIQTGRTFRVGPVRTLLQIVLPAAAPAIFAGLRISLSIALIATVVGEMIAGSSGLGYLILHSQYAMQQEQMYSAIICLMVIGYGLNRLFVQVEKVLLHWYQTADGT
jgi:ABC-type nitrate/sulfonate/bicarbonate transport system permease component